MVPKRNKCIGFASAATTGTAATTATTMDIVFAYLFTFPYLVQRARFKCLHPAEDSQPGDTHKGSRSPEESPLFASGEDSPRLPRVIQVRPWTRTCTIQLLRFLTRRDFTILSFIVIFAIFPRYFYFVRAPVVVALAVQLLKLFCLSEVRMVAW